MSVNENLGQRMKTYYEQIPQTKLLRRTPVAIRIDGKAFHTFTRGFQKPFDEILGNAMIKTMEYLCKNIQNCEFGYTESDEITLLLSEKLKINISDVYKNLLTTGSSNFYVDEQISLAKQNEAQYKKIMAEYDAELEKLSTSNDINAIQNKQRIEAEKALIK